MTRQKANGTAETTPEEAGTVQPPPATPHRRPLASDILPSATAEHSQRAESMYDGGEAIRQLAAPLTLEATCGQHWTDAGHLPFVGQHEQILRDSGRSTDPVEIMLLEQLQAL
jgi:hypothetical protein